MLSLTACIISKIELLNEKHAQRPLSSFHVLHVDGFSIEWGTHFDTPWNDSILLFLAASTAHPSSSRRVPCIPVHSSLRAARPKSNLLHPVAPHRTRPPSEDINMPIVGLQNIYLIFFPQPQHGNWNCIWAYLQPPRASTAEMFRQILCIMQRKYQNSSWQCQQKPH